MSKLTTLLCVLGLLVVFTPRARAHDPAPYAYPPPPVPCCAPSYGVQQTPAHVYVHHDHVHRREHGSAFGSAYRGLLAGGITGLGVGYLVARDGGHGLRDEGWRALVFGSGVGALTGAGLGLTLHLLEPRIGHYASRDLLYGSMLGALAGATAGGLSAVVGSDAEHILLGAGIGTAVGAGVGLLTGLLQARRSGRDLAYQPPRRTLAFAPTDPQGHGWSASVRGVF